MAVPAIIAACVAAVQAAASAIVAIESARSSGERKTGQAAMQHQGQQQAADQ